MSRKYERGVGMMVNLIFFVSVSGLKSLLMMSCLPLGIEGTLGFGGSLGFGGTLWG